MEIGPGVMVRLLGPVDVVVGGEETSVGGPRLRRLLLALALAAGSTVSEERLADAVWGEQDSRPENVRGTLQNYVYRLRSVLGGEAIQTDSAGYRLAAFVEVDAAQLDELFALASALVERSEVTAASAAIQRARHLWRGEPFGELVDVEWGRADALALEERHLPG